MKNVILGVTGSIAAYKALLLVRLLVKSGYDVKVLMTPTSKEFVAPLSFETLSKNEVHSDIISEESWNNHVDLGLWADVMIIAPATAVTLSKMASGLSDNIVVATYLSAKCPVLFAPAMDLDMWKHPATQANVEQLEGYGNQLIPVGFGELASGLVGDGRMAEPEDIFSIVQQLSKKKADLSGKKVLITAGPTQERIDPVRFISNFSTGRMGIALAEECASRGATVSLVLGPTQLTSHVAQIRIISVLSADEMFKACQEEWEDVDIAFFAAAVADYTPAAPSHEKVKKKEGELSIPLKRTTDIALTLGSMKKNEQISVGFALETSNEKFNAVEKMNKKNFDLIVLNSLKDKGAGFGHTTNKVTIFTKNGLEQSFDLKSKKDVAADIVDMTLSLIHENNSDD